MILVYKCLLCAVLLLWSPMPLMAAASPSPENPARMRPLYRVVSLSTSGVECLQLMGQLDTVVGVSDYTQKKTRFPTLSGIPSVGRGFGPNIEKIVELHPDIVVTWKANPGPELERQLTPFGIQVLRADLTDPTLIPEEMRFLASFFGPEARQRTEIYLQLAETYLAAVQQGIAAYPKPRVLAEHFTPFRIAGPGSGLYGITLLAGAENLAHAIGVRSMQADTEWILEKNPDAYIKAVLPSMRGNASHLDTLYAQELSARKNWNLCRAVQKNRVCILSSDKTSGPFYITGVLDTAAFLYPEAKLPTSADFCKKLQQALHDTRIVF